MKSTTLRRLAVLSLPVLLLLLAVHVAKNRFLSGQSSVTGKASEPPSSPPPVIETVSPAETAAAENSNRSRTVQEQVAAARNWLTEHDGQWGRKKGYFSGNEYQRIAAHFDDAGVSIRPMQEGVAEDAWTWDIDSAGSLRTDKSRLSRECGGIEEWWISSPAGFEQGWTIRNKSMANADGTLTVPVKITSTLKAVLQSDRRGADFCDDKGRPVLTYDHLVAYDAHGRALPAEMSCATDGSGSILITAHAAEAVFPVTIDPLVSTPQSVYGGSTSANDYDGTSVLVTDDFAFSGKTGNGGEVVAYTRYSYPDSWSDEQTISPPEANAEFGQTLAGSNNWLAVGGPAAGGKGAVYLYKRAPGTPGKWEYTQKLQPADLAAGDEFGSAIYMDGDILAAAAPKSNLGAADSGAVYVFTLSSGQWVQRRRLQPSTTQADGHFGASVAVRGTWLVIGAPERDDAGTDRGAAWLHEQNMGGADNFGFAQKIEPGGSDAGLSFGSAAGISDGWLAIGESGMGSAETGGVYLYKRAFGPGSFWSWQKTITAPDGQSKARFGSYLALHDGSLLAGGVSNGTVADNTALAILFERDAGGSENWGVAERFRGYPDKHTPRPAPVSMRGSMLMIGMPKQKAFVIANSGGFLLMERSSCGWTRTASDGAYAEVDNDLQLDEVTSIATSGDLVFAGHPEAHDGTGNEDYPGKGMVHVSRRHDNSFHPQPEIIQPSGFGKGFGRRVAACGDIVAVSSEQNWVWLFQRDESLFEGWRLLKSIGAPSGYDYKGFGESLALREDLLVVGAASANPADASAGYVAVYQRKVSNPDDYELIKVIKNPALITPEGDRFGAAIALDGDRLLAGSPGSVAGYAAPGGGLFLENDGAAWLFERHLNGTNAWGMRKSFYSGDSVRQGTDHYQFGASVALRGSWAVIGSPGRGNREGSASIFFRNEDGADAWGGIRLLTEPDNDPLKFASFGTSVAVSGDGLVAVGAPSDSRLGGGQGCVWLYERNSGVLGFGSIGRIGAPFRDYAGSIIFGTRIALEGRTLIATEANHDPVNPGYPRIHVYEMQFRKFQAVPDAGVSAPASTGFGAAMAMADGRMAVSAPDEASGRGYVYLFTRNEGGRDEWDLEKKIGASDGDSSDKFGSALAMDAGAIVAGAPGRAAAYVFERNLSGGDAWGQRQKLTAVTGGEFGASVALDGTKLVVGAPSAAVGGIACGTAVLYLRDGVSASVPWSYTADFNPAPGTRAAGDRFGSAAAVGSTLLAIGSPGYQSGKGRFVVFKTDFPWTTVSDHTGAAGDSLGSVLAMSGWILAVGAPGAKEGGLTSGCVWIHRADEDKDHSLLARLAPPATQNSQKFGSAIDMAGNLIAVGASGHALPFIGASVGQVFLFDRNHEGEDTWGLWQAIEPISAAQNRKFGTAVALENFWLGASVPGTNSAEMFTLAETPYQNWARLHFGDSVDVPGQAGSLWGGAADPDKDRIPNLLEAWAGLDPLAADAPVISSISFDVSGPKLRLRRAGNTHGVNAIMEYSQDLKTWTALQEDVFQEAKLHRTIQQNDTWSLIEISLQQDGGAPVTAKLGFWRLRAWVQGQ